MLYVSTRAYCGCKKANPLDVHKQIKLSLSLYPPHASKWGQALVVFARVRIKRSSKAWHRMMWNANLTGTKTPVHLLHVSSHDTSTWTVCGEPAWHPFLVLHICMYIYNGHASHVTPHIRVLSGGARCFPIQRQQWEKEQNRTEKKRERSCKGFVH